MPDFKPPFPALESCTQRANRLNRECHCVSLDRNALQAALAREMDSAEAWHLIEAERPHLFASSTAYLGRQHMAQMRDVISAIEQVVALPAYQEQVLSWAPANACQPKNSTGVFLGYDFHVSHNGPWLIEINTNAGGAMLVTALSRAHRHCCADHIYGDGPAVEQIFLDMFRTEWRLERGGAPLQTIAIVDDDPTNQFLYPEFLLFSSLFRRAGIKVVLCDPQELILANGRLLHDEQPVDMVYNRVTDFSLAAHSSLFDAYHTGAAVITPHPRAHALYADKRNLVVLSDDSLLQSLGVDQMTRTQLLTAIPRTERVSPDQADDFWARRKQLFFKPAGGFGSKAAYRGDKLTKRVFSEILAGDYVAQTLALPGERHIGKEPEHELKIDLRHYVYQGAVQLSTARLYQGQTTNFRTPGGGFAPLIVVDGGPSTPS